MTGSGTAVRPASGAVPVGWVSLSTGSEPGPIGSATGPGSAPRRGRAPFTRRPPQWGP
ncbi:hypothetical protein CZ771_10805 [Actinomycetales bacterium JB111]|nr:hypothetical protein CZ771_10805 [Actinomycetales bacterium JB111]